jgi:outer membrane beta-barrel protein
MRSLGWLLLFLPLAAFGEELPGIDLTKPPAPPAPPAPEAEKPSRQKADALEQAVGVPGERDAALEDRVKAVQRKGFLKRGRFQFTAFFAPTLNDAFYMKYGLGGRLAYNFQDSFAMGVSYTEYCLPIDGKCKLTARTDSVRQGTLAFQSELLNSALYRDAFLEGIWSPVYGKASWLGHSIVHFDVYLLAGLGLVWSATSVSPRSEGPHLGTEVGGGIRFYPSSWVALELGLYGKLYTDQARLGLPATLQKAIGASLGVSFFLPTRFEYVYP